MKNKFIKVLLSIFMIIGLIQINTKDICAEDTTDYLCFTAEEANSTVKLTKNGTPTVVSLETSTDKSTWADYTIDTIINLINVGDKVYFRNKSETTTGFSVDYSNYYQFVMTGEIAASGDVTILINKNGTKILTTNYCFESLFENCASLKSISENLLLATTLTKGCYALMFNNCLGLVSLPDSLLPAIDLSDECYATMFGDCSGLTSLPENLLPATNLAKECYVCMFNGCSGLTSIPENLLPATNLSDRCYSGMFSNCTGLTSIPENLLPATNLASNCYGEMFSFCSNITTLPKLPATTLAPACYGGGSSGSVDGASLLGMFSGCTSLTSIPDGYLPATNLADACYDYMFYGCSALTSIPVNLLPATVLKPGCYSEMFSGCANLKMLPSLPATVLADLCYVCAFPNADISNTQTIEYSAPFRIPTNGSITVRGTNDTASMFGFGTPDDLDGDGVITLYIKPYPVTITYSGNGNDGGAVPTDSGPYQYGDNVTIKDNINSLTKTGYIFMGWNTKADGTGTTYQASDILTIIGNTTLYTKWGTYTFSTSNNMYVKGSLKNKLFVCDGPLANLTSVKVDDTEITEATQYIKESGSTKITLLGSYLEGLFLGNHTLKLTYSDGPIPITTFNVVEPSNNGSSNNGNINGKYIIPNTGIK